jgi:hypothetical protein
MREFKVIKSSTFEDFYFTQSEFNDWYFRSTVYGLEPYDVMMQNIKDPKYANGYYIGMGYKVLYSPETVGVVPVAETKNSCQHKNKYFNKISNTLQFWVCPDCKQEIKESEKIGNSDWWIGI